MVELARHLTGTGPPLVLVHGTSTDHASFRKLAPLLAERFTAIAVDRRGRGDSGDADGYRIEDEFDDLAVLVDSISGPAALLGHSFGATVALGAATRTANVSAVVAYEPSPGIVALSDEQLAWLEEASRTEIVEYVLREFAGMPAGEIETLRASPDWERRLAFAHTVAREVRAEQECELDTDGVDVPVLFLLGSESPGWARDGTERLASRLRDARIAVLEGEGHVAMLTSPERVADEVLAFLGRRAA